MERTYPSEHKDLLGQLLRDGTLSPALLDRLLGAYTIFEYRAAGVTAFCSKPLFMSDLRNVMIEAGRRCGEKDPPAEKTRPRFSCRRVLVAEDNELNREIVTEILESSGFQVETASDGSIAVDMVRRAEEGYYDLILMDIQMPVMNGYEATRLIRGLADPSFSEIPIVAMTANAFEEDRKQAREAGMNGFIAKPLSADELWRVLGQVLRKREDCGSDPP